MKLQILEPRDINNGNSTIHDTSLRIDNAIMEGRNISSSVNLTTTNAFSNHQVNIGPTAASALLFNNTPCINNPNDVNNSFQFSGGGGLHDGINLSTTNQISSWPHKVTNFRQQQQIQRNLLIFKQQKAAAVAAANQNQQHSFLRQQNNVSPQKRVLYQTPSYNFLKPNPLPPPPSYTPPQNQSERGLVSFDISPNSCEAINQQQQQLTQLSNLLQNTETNSSDASKV